MTKGIIMQAKTGRFELRLDEDMIEKVDRWRAEQSGLPSRSDAVRRLIAQGLAHEERGQLFQIARLSVISAALSSGPNAAISDDYLYAWKNSVYPFFNETSLTHQPFANQFDIPSEKVDELSEFLDYAWREGQIPSFYNLEDHYEVRRGGGFWTRSRLIKTCRYMFLGEMFDGKFWEALLRGSEHPAEAKSITREFDRNELTI